MSVEARASYMTTCASETDDGDYETSSEGAVRDMQGKQIKEMLPRNLRKIGSDCDYEAENPRPKEEKSSEKSSCNQEAALASRILSKSESMPVLKSTSSSKEENEEESSTMMSESSIARQRKMKMIVTRINPELSSASNQTSSTDTFVMRMIDENYESKKLESKIVLPMLQNTSNDSPSCTKEVTFFELPEEISSKEFDQERKSSRCSGGIGSTIEEAKNSRNTQENDDLIGIAENPHPSIKSFYFPPIPEKGHSCLHQPRQQSRITKDTDAILKIDGELGPLQHQLNEISGKFRALNLNVPSLPGQSHYCQYTPSTDMSGYYLRRTETFGQDSKGNEVIRLMGQHQSNKNYTALGPGTKTKETLLTQDSFSMREPISRNISFTNEDSYSLMAPRVRSSKHAERNVSTIASDWRIEDNNNYASVRNSYANFGGPVDRDPSGSLIPSVSSSCYRPYRNEAFDYQKPHSSKYYDESEFSKSKKEFAKKNETKLGSGRTIDHRCQNVTKRLDKMAQAGTSGVGCGSGKLIRTLDASTVTSGPDLRVISVNTSVKERYTYGKVVGESSYNEGTSGTCQRSNNESNSSLIRPQDQSILASVMVIGSEGSGRTRYVNRSRVNSQASLVISKKDQDSMTTILDRRQNEFSGKQTMKQLRVSNVIDQKSIETLVKSSESINNSKTDVLKNLSGIKMAKTDEKVVIVPILFTNGIPEPPRTPLFHFNKSRCHLSKTNHHLTKLERRPSSITQNSVYSGNSLESSTMEYLNLDQKLANKNSGMSMSCVSRSGSYSRCRNPSHLSNITKSLSDRHHSRGRHSHSSKAQSDPTRRVKKKAIQGMMSSPEEFLCDT